MAGDEDPKHPHPPPSFSPPPAAKPKAKAKEPSEMAYRGKLHASEGAAEAQLGDSEAKEMSLVEGRLWRESTGRDIPPLIQTMRHCLL